MFKKAVSTFSKWSSKKRLIAISLVLAVFFGLIHLFVWDNIRLFCPKQGVYPFLNGVATSVINEKSTEFLINPDSYESFKIIGNAGYLNYYIETRNSQTHTITLELHGPCFEVLTLVISDDYQLISLNKFHNFETLGLLAITLAILYIVIGMAITFSINYILRKLNNLTVSLKTRITNIKKRKQQNYAYIESGENAGSEYDSEEDDYCAEDYDEM